MPNPLAERWILAVVGTQVAGHSSSVAGRHQGPGVDAVLMTSVFELESPLCSVLSKALGRSSLFESLDARKGHFETHFTDQGTVCNGVFIKFLLRRRPWPETSGRLGRKGSVWSALSSSHFMEDDTEVQRGPMSPRPQPCGYTGAAPGSKNRSPAPRPGASSRQAPA